jgi:hypothetical protein
VQGQKCGFLSWKNLRRQEMPTGALILDVGKHAQTCLAKATNLAAVTKIGGSLLLNSFEVRCLVASYTRQSYITLTLSQLISK